MLKYQQVLRHLIPGYATVIKWGRYEAIKDAIGWKQTISEDGIDQD